MVFLVIAAGAFAVLSTATQPNVEVEAAHTLSQGETLTLGGTQYTLSSVSDSSAEFTWTNESYVYSATLQNNTTVQYQEDSWVVDIPNTSDPAEFTLRESLNVTQILRDDPDVRDELLTGPDGEKYVRYQNGSTRLLSEYLPEPRTVQFAKGDTMEYDGNETTVDALTKSKVTLTWRGVRNLSTSGAPGENVTLGDQTFLVHVPESGQTRAVLSQDFAGYQHSVDRIDYFDERVKGLWGVAELSALAAAVLLAVAYLPSRY